MASEIRVNQIQSRTGVSTISFTETGPIFAGVSTVQGLFTVDENLNVGNNLNVTGDITATNGTFSGDVTVGGTLTYDDVTNIDSVGVITARDGIHVTGVGSSVGIGTDNPHHKLHIQGSGDTRALITSGGTGDALMMFESASGETWGHGIDLTNNNYVIAYSHLGDPNLTNDGALRITSDGKTGLGLDNPNARFHVHSSSSHVATFEYSATSDCAIQLKNSQGSMYFGLGGGEEFMVGIGTDLNGAGNTKLSVDSTGRFRTPDQAAALVYKTGTTQAFSADGLVTYDATTYSQGGITITNTRSRMTVPVAGKYMVNACTSGSVSSLSAGDGWKLQILKNGSVYNDTYGYPIETTGSTAGQELAYTVSMVVDCDASDYIEIKIENIGGAQANMSYGYFGIYLLG